MYICVCVLYIEKERERLKKRDDEAQQETTKRHNSKTYSIHHHRAKIYLNQICHNARETKEKKPINKIKTKILNSNIKTLRISDKSVISGASKSSYQNVT